MSTITRIAASTAMVDAPERGGLRLGNGIAPTAPGDHAGSGSGTSITSELAASVANEGNAVDTFGGGAVSATAPRGGPQEAFFAGDGDSYMPNAIARSAWGETVGGHIIGGLLGLAAEREVNDPTLHAARLTVDLLRPTLLEPLRLRAKTVRDGKRLRLIDVSATQNGELVARASALFLRRSEQPTGQVWSPTHTMPPPPVDPAPSGPSFFASTYGWGWFPVEQADPHRQGDGTKYAWMQITRPLVDGEPITAFGRAAMASDLTAAICNWGEKGLEFINADYTVTLSRLPRGPLLGLASHDHLSNDGIAAGSATLFDVHGPIGSTVSAAIAHGGLRLPVDTAEAKRPMGELFTRG